MSVETGAAYSSSCQRSLAFTFRAAGVWLPDMFAKGVDHCGRSLKILLEIASKTIKSQSQFTKIGSVCCERVQIYPVMKLPVA